MNVDLIYDNLKQEIESEHTPVIKFMPVVINSDCLLTDFNRKYEPPVKFVDRFNKFAHDVFKIQMNGCVHQLTCGVDSNHKELVPRITTKGTQVLVCPTCGYVQDSIWFIDQYA